MSRKIDLTGRRYGKLLVIKEVEPYISPSGRRYTSFLCKCDCGNNSIVRSDNLRSNNTKSCGCGEIENSRKNGRRCVTSGDLRKASELTEYKGTKITNIESNKLPSHNTSGVKGVGWDNSRKKWIATIEFKSKRHYLGRFTKKDDAIKARKEAEEKFFKPIIEEFYKNKENEKQKI